MPISSSVFDELCQKAVDAMAYAYAPYSGYLVGAAVLTDGGNIYRGANVENASYGLAICAERVAVANAVSQGERKLTAVAVATKDGGSPCGACRQVLAEFAEGSLQVILVHAENGSRTQFTLDDLLPQRFSIDRGD